MSGTSMMSRTVRVDVAAGRETRDGGGYGGGSGSGGGYGRDGEARAGVLGRPCYGLTMRYWDGMAEGEDRTTGAWRNAGPPGGARGPPPSRQQESDRSEYVPLATTTTPQDAWVVA
jgi:hypothetical protein